MKLAAFTLIGSAPLIGLWVSCVSERWQTGVLVWAGWTAAQASIGAVLLLGGMR